MFDRYLTVSRILCSRICSRQLGCTFGIMALCRSTVLLNFHITTEEVTHVLFHIGIILEAEASLNQAQTCVSDSQT